MELFKNYVEILEKQYQYNKTILESIQKDVEKTIEYSLKQFKSIIK